MSGDIFCPHCHKADWYHEPWCKVWDTHHTQKFETAQKEATNKYGLEPGKLQWAWRHGERDNPNELEDAIIDALAMGSIYAWPGDGVGCVAQIVQYWMDRAKKAEEEVVFGFYEEEYPIYTQGYKKGVHELTSPITSVEANGMAQKIKSLREQIEQQKQLIEHLQSINERLANIALNTPSKQ